LNSIQHLTKSRTYKILKQVHGQDSLRVEQLLPLGGSPHLNVKRHP
jgi:hypothetical protein